MHRPAVSEWLVASSRVEGEGANQDAVIGDDPDVAAGDEQADFPVLVRNADWDVAEPAEVAKCDLAEGIDLVAADAVVGGRRLLGRLGFDE